MTKWSTAVLSGVALSLAVPLICACSSSTAHASAPAAESTCQRVSAVLSDGPDPDDDPVGYAEAQVLPLHQLKLADATLSQAVRRLDAAYKAFSATNGAKGTAAAVKVSAAQTALNAICANAAP